MTEYKRMQQRNDTAANWMAINPILAAGEIGYDRTNKKIKIGDGATAWDTLPYHESGGGGGGTTYTAGDGIDITSDTISVDANTAQFTMTGGKLNIITNGANGFVTTNAMNIAINSVLGSVVNDLQEI